MAHQLGRRDFLKLIGPGTAGLTIAGLRGRHALLAPDSAEAAAWCWCVGYVRNFVRDKWSTALKPIPSGYAKDMGVVLDPAGFHSSTLPDPTDHCIVVFQPRFNNYTSKYKWSYWSGTRSGYNWIVDPIAGHAGIVLKSQVTQPGKLIKLIMRSANYGGHATRNDCTNVSDVVMEFPCPSAAVRFWIRD